MFLQRKLKRELGDRRAQQQLLRRAQDTDFEDGTGKNTWSSSFNEPPRALKLQQDNFIANELFFGRGMDYTPPTQPHPQTFLGWKTQEELRNRHFDSQAHLEEAQRHKDRLNKKGHLQTMLKPLPDPDNPNPKEKKTLRESYAQRIGFDITPHQEKIFDSTYGHDIKQLKQALKNWKLLRSRTPHANLS